MTSIQHANPTSAPRNETGPLSYAPPANHWLRMLYAALQKIRCLMACVAPGDEWESNEDVAPDDGFVEILGANSRAKATSVTNNGALTVQVREGGITVAIVAPFKTAELPMRGLLAISAGVQPGQIGTGGSSVTVTRRVRCACGDDAVVYATEPVGAYLL